MSNIRLHATIFNLNSLELLKLCLNLKCLHNQNKNKNNSSIIVFFFMLGMFPAFKTIPYKKLSSISLCLQLSSPVGLGLTALTSLFTYSSHLRRDLPSSLFPIRSSLIIIFIIESFFLQACSAHNKLLFHYILY